MYRNAVVYTGVLLALTAVTLSLSGCSGTSSSARSSNAPATVNLTISDPPTCSGPQGPYSHIYVTITDVQINASSTAAPSGPGWIDLTPKLAQNPQQVDLLGQANNQCFLATLGSTTALQPGTYRQMRILLAANSVTVPNNHCGSNANCVMLTTDMANTPLPLLLSSEALTGLKIPSGQIAGGQFVIAAGQTKDLNIDFDACASIVAEGNGQFRLKPVLHAGEVMLTGSSINGTIVDSSTEKAIVGGKTVVALEQKDSSGIDRVIMETVTNPNGTFVFCPVATGIYDVVAVAINGAGGAYAPTLITGVQPGSAMGIVPLVVEVGLNTAPASINGEVTTSTGSTGTAADISISALQTIFVNNSKLLVTIPLASQSAATLSVTTAATVTCPPNVDCANYSLSVPSVNPAVGTFSTGGSQKPAAPASGAVDYIVDALAFVPASGGTLDCSPSDLRTSFSFSKTSLTVTAGTNTTAATLAFSGCQ